MNRDFTFKAGPIGARWRRFGFALTLSATVGSLSAGAAVIRPPWGIVTGLALSATHAPRNGSVRIWRWPR